MIWNTFVFPSLNFLNFHIQCTLYFLGLLLCFKVSVSKSLSEFSIIQEKMFSVHSVNIKKMFHTVP